MGKPVLIFIATFFLASTASQCGSAPPASTALPPAPWSVIVMSAADSGSGTLRQALEDARPGDSITFDPRIFPPNAPVTISLIHGLPEISQGGVSIDASSAGVILDGSAVTVGGYGLSISSNGNAVRGLQIAGTRFATEEETQGYLNYVRFVVEHFRGRVRYYELWNEPGGKNPETGGPSNLGIYVDVYPRVITRAVPIIRQADPEARIVIGALGGDWISGFPGYGEYSPSLLHMEYLRRLITSGVAPLVDGISWHPFYGNRPDDPYYQTYPDFVGEIKELAASQGFGGEYFAEEIKYYTAPVFEGGSPPVVAEKVAAGYFARAIVMHLGLGFNVSTAGQLAYDGLVADVIRTLCTVMEAASPAGLPMEVHSEAANIRAYCFSFPDRSHLVALWNNGIAVDDDPGVSATLTFPGLSSRRAVGMDVLNGFEQELTAGTENGALVIGDLRVKGYPTVLRFID